MAALRRIVLAAPIEGAPKPSDFRLEEAPLPALGEGQALIRTLYCSVDPGTRSRLSGGGPSYAPNLKAGDVIDGFCVGQVIESRNPRVAKGALVALGGGWADHVLFPGRGFIQPIPHRRVPLSLWIGVLGVPGMTAYFGLTRVGALKEGDRVLVTSAAGPVGATAGQIAKRLGASRVVGVAGGAAKGAWLRDAAGFDEVIDYKAAPDLSAALARALPEGVDLLFDNIGNAMIEHVMPLMRLGGRIVVSGQTADYNTPADALPPLRFTRPFITHRVRMEGLVVFDDLRGFPEAQARVCDWITDDALAYRETMFDGLERAPEAFIGLFTDPDTFGRRIVRVAPEPAP